MNTNYKELLDILEKIKYIVEELDEGDVDSLDDEGDRQLGGYPSDELYKDYPNDEILKDTSKYENAILCYDKAIEIDPKHCVAWERKAMVCAALGRHEEAVRCFDKAIEIESPKGDDWYLASIWGWKGSAYEHLKKYDEAKECFKNSKKIQSSFEAKMKSMSDAKKSSS